MVFSIHLQPLIYLRTLMREQRSWKVSCNAYVEEDFEAAVSSRLLLLSASRLIKLFLMLSFAFSRCLLRASTEHSSIHYTYAVRRLEVLQPSRGIPLVQDGITDVLSKAVQSCSQVTSSVGGSPASGRARPGA
jgi:hypothetical protein